MGLKPDLDEIEISVFGPGYGECVVAHLGFGNWIIVDSFLDVTDRPVASSYLSSLGVTPSDVKLLVATHWDDDHIKGFSDLVSEFSTAQVLVSQALQGKEFGAFVQKYVHSGTKRISSGVSEISKTGRLEEPADFGVVALRGQFRACEAPFSWL